MTLAHTDGAVDQVGLVIAMSMASRCGRNRLECRPLQGAIIAEPLERRDALWGTAWLSHPAVLLSLASLLVLNWWLFRRAMQAVENRHPVDRSFAQRSRPIKVERPRSN